MKAFFFILIFVIIIIIPSAAYAETVQGRNYDDTFLGYDSQGNEIHRWSSHPERIYDNGWKDYKLSQNSTTILLETANSGAVAFSKSGCSYSLYNNGIINTNDHPQVAGISYTVKGKANSSNTWSNVNSVNNAACTPTIIESGNGTVKILGTKVNGVGTFQIELKYNPGGGIKETLRAYNNNPTWTNNNIGFTEKFEVPQTISFGKNNYDLSLYNNTVLDRNWITTNKAGLIQLGNKIFYDFGIGFNNLQDIKITWINYHAYLSLNYLYGGYIVPYQQWIEVDPTFGPAADTSYKISSPVGVGVSCPTGVYTKAAVTGDARVAQSNDAGDGCQRAIAAWDITVLPTNAIVVDSDASFTSSAPFSMAGKTCDSYRVMNNPATAAAALLWNDAQDGSLYVSATASCQTANTYSIDLGSTADSDIQASRSAGNTTFAISVKLTDETRDAGSAHSTSFINNAITLTVVYVNQKPDAVTTLHDTDITTTSVDLAWSTPNLNGGTCSGYQINYTSPWGQPTTILTNDTAVCTTTYTVSSLILDTDYSFRVSARTQLGVNGSGNILNVTTNAFNAANYTIGSFNFNANNPILFPIRFERIDNGSSTYVNVTFTNTINLACDLRYTYAGTNHTYHTIPSIPVSASEDEAQFRFTNSSNDITTFHCWNQAGNQSANYVLTQTDFLLKQQVRDFRNGTYGTMGQFGAFDLITLIVVIISLIGLNRNTEAVAGIFCIMAITVLAYFEIVSWVTAIVSAAAVIMLFIVAGTKKT